RRGIQTFLDALRRGFARRGVPLADVQIQPDAFVEFLLFGVLPEHRLKQFQRVVEVVTLQRFDTLFVNRDRFDIRRSGRGGGWRGVVWERGNGKAFGRVSRRGLPLGGTRRGYRRLGFQLRLQSLRHGRCYPSLSTTRSAHLNLAET